MFKHWSSSNLWNSCLFLLRTYSCQNSKFLQSFLNFQTFLELRSIPNEFFYQNIHIHTLFKLCFNLVQSWNFVQTVKIFLEVQTLLSGHLCITMKQMSKTLITMRLNSLASWSRQSSQIDNGNHIWLLSLNIWGLLKKRELLIAVWSQSHPLTLIP